MRNIFRTYLSNKIRQAKSIKIDHSDKPYIKKIYEIAGFDVWIVDGNYIRKNIDEDFVNFDQHFHLKFIPKNEFWIDKDNMHKEEKYYIDHMFIENWLMGMGKSYIKAYEEAAKFAKKERAKSEVMIKLNKKIKHKQELIKSVHKTLWKEFSKDLKVWIVNGELVRDLFFIDYAGGGHNRVYHFIPENEIWIDDDITSKTERRFILLHETHERNIMLQGKNYAEAHKSATEIEDYARRNPRKADYLIKREMSKDD